MAPSPQMQRKQREGGHQAILKKLKRRWCRQLAFHEEFYCLYEKEGELHQFLALWDSISIYRLSAFQYVCFPLPYWPYIVLDFETGQLGLDCHTTAFLMVAGQGWDVFPLAQKVIKPV